MKFTRIQHAETHEIIQYRLDQNRVTRGQYIEEERRQQQHNRLTYQYMSSVTTRTRTGNFKHSFCTNW